MTKTYKINYQGKEETIELETNPRAGVALKIGRAALKFKSGQALPEIDFEEFIISVSTSLILKAPWTVQTQTPYATYH